MSNRDKTSMTFKKSEETFTRCYLKRNKTKQGQVSLQALNWFSSEYSWLTIVYQTRQYNDCIWLKARLPRATKSTNLYPSHQHCSGSRRGSEGRCSCSCLVRCLCSRRESGRCHYKEWGSQTNATHVRKDSRWTHKHLLSTNMIPGGLAKTPALRHLKQAPSFRARTKLLCYEAKWTSWS